MTDKQKRKIQASQKHIEVARKALNCVDADCLFEDPDREYASELFQKWQTIQYYLGDLYDAFELALYEADNSD